MSAFDVTPFLARTAECAASAECGCMASRHAFLTSCLGCGRIACANERGARCFHCARELYAPSSGARLSELGLEDQATLRAYLQKDRLLLFDSENTKRTHVLDAQGDYYESAAWLSEQEKTEYERKERVRRERLHRRRTVSAVSLDLRTMAMAASESDEQVEPAAGEGSSAASAAALEARAEAGGGKEEGDDKQEGGGADIENVELGLSNSRAASVYRAIKKSFAGDKDRS